jgi:ABC-2 type transport system ATP-binding protein
MSMERVDTPAVQVRGVTKRFGTVVALDDVSLDVGGGELVGLLGPNGAGKSTLLSLVSEQRRPDAGTVRLYGRDPRSAPARVPLGLTPQETGLPPTLHVAEVVDFVGAHYPDPVPSGELLEQFGLAELGRRQTGSLSGGQKRRLAVALALVGRPRLVLLDEPTTGLDVAARSALWAAIREYHAGGGTVLLTSHYLEEVQALAERVVIIDQGAVRADDSLDAVLRRVRFRRVVVRGEARFDELPGVARAERVTATEPGDDAVYGRPGDRLPPRWELFTPDADALVRELVASGLPFEGIEIRGASLEEAFAQMVGAGTGTGTGTAPARDAADPDSTPQEARR